MASSTLIVRLKFVDGYQIPEVRDKVAEELAILNLFDRTGLSIIARGVYELPDGLKVRVRNEKDVERICSDKCKQMLLEHGLIPLASPEKLANQTTVIYTRSPLIHSSSEEQLKREVKDQHAGVTVDSIWKDQRLGIMKIVCRTSEQAEKVRSKELKLRGYTLMPEDLVKAYYIPIQQCLRCYRLDSHTSSTCKDEQTYCGQCGATGHRHTDCKSDFTACINCIRANAPPEKRRHNARSNTCPQKKKQLQKERKKMRGRSGTPAGRNPVEFQDAPAPTTNAWGQKPQTNRSASRSRRNRRGSQNSRKSSVSAPPHKRNAPPQATRPPAESATNYPDLAHNARERRNKKKKKNKGGNNTSTTPMEQSRSASARQPAGSVGGEWEDGTMDHDELDGLLAREGFNPEPLPARRETFPEALAKIESERPRTARIARPSNINEINIILTASHHHNVTRPGEFNKRANQLFKRANLPAVDLGDDWHSEEFLAAISSLGSNEVGTKNINCNCKCSCKKERPQTQTRTLGTNTDKISTSPKEQRLPAPSRQSLTLHPPSAPEPPSPNPTEASIVILEEMDSQSQGLKRARTDSPVEPENLKRNRETSPTLQKNASKSSSSSEEEGNGTIIGPSVPNSWEELAGEEAQVSPNETQDFTDAQSILTSVDVPVISTPIKSGTVPPSIDDLPEVPQLEKNQPEKEMPPPSMPVSGGARSKNLKLRLSPTITPQEEGPKTPTFPKRIPDLTQGNTPLKRTSSTLVLHEPLPPTQTYSQLDRAMEQACMEEKEKNAHKHKRNSSVGRTPQFVSKSAPRRGLDKLDMIKQVIAADHIARSKLRIITTSKKLGEGLTKGGLAKEMSSLPVPKLISLWRQGEIVMEVVPRTQSTDGKEPQWRINKYATLTRTLYEDRIEAKEWEKHRRKILISVEDPTMITLESLNAKKDEVNLKVMENIRLHRDVGDLERFFSEVELSPIKNARPSPKTQTPEDSGDVDFFSPSNSYNQGI